VSPSKVPALPAIVKSFDTEILVNLGKWKDLAKETKVPHIELVTETASEAFLYTKLVLHSLAESKNSTP